MQDATTPLPPPSPEEASRPAWESFLPLLDTVDIRAEVLHPVRVLRLVPTEHSEAFLVILERACALIAQAEATGNLVLLKRSERLLLLLPKLVLKAPVLPPQASQSMPLGTLARESASVAHRLQRFHSGAWIELISSPCHSYRI